LDGRNRARACELADVPIRTQFYTGDDPITFSVSLNIVRRHLTAGQRAALAVALEPLYAEEAARRKREAGESYGRGHPKEEGKLVADLPQAKRESRERKSRERAAKQTGASGRATAQFKRVQQQAPDLAAKVRAGDMALDRAERIIRDREAEQRRIEQARREAAAEPVPTRVDIRHGDFREVFADLSGIDAVITDPPYPREFLPLLADLAAWADKVLTPEGVLAVLMGQSHLPEVYRLLDGHRPYRWTACWLTPAQGYVAHAQKVQTNWKPLLVYGQGPRFADIIRSEGSDAAAKTHHRWGQDYNGFHTLVERLTSRGQTVVDPFMGSGTTLLAAHALGRHAAGCDIDPAAVATARERLA
jgi:16S rRNA G966 N2-methylase RsmD